jgi:uncharacterized protein (DUF1499 family)
MKGFLSKLRLLMMVVIVLILLGFGILGFMSQNQENKASYDQVEMSLGICPEKPNCVSSFTKPNNSHYIAPLNITPERLPLIHDYFAKDCTLQSKSHNYRYYTCKSPIFGFVDDVETLFLEETKSLHFRSASRVGHSDLGKNKERIEKLKSFLGD